MQGRKNFMRRKYILTFFNQIKIAEFGDSIVKRELFAVSLRKDKKHEILKEKRRKIIESSNVHKAQLIQIVSSQPQIEDLNQNYQGYPVWS
jgi:DNA-directed RNA polymerase subunit H (RpoH/RPB5)